MALRNRTEAYDLSLFETRPLKVEVGGQPAEKPAQRQKRRNNVIELPEKDLKKNRRAHPHSLKMAAVIGTCTLMLATVGCVVMNQVQLNELTSQITAAQQTLDETESVHTQLQMQANASMTLNDVEQYAKDQLDMRKTGKNQVTYITLTEGDQGNVVQPGGEESILDKLWGFFQSLLA